MCRKEKFLQVEVEKLSFNLTQYCAIESADAVCAELCRGMLCIVLYNFFFKLVLISDLFLTHHVVCFRLCVSTGSPIIFCNSEWGIFGNDYGIYY